MSDFVGARAHDVKCRNNSAATSDILSTSALLSSISIANESIHEWVLFSPVESLSGESRGVQNDGSDISDEFGLRSAERNRQHTVEDSYVSAISLSGLEFPSHNGSGAFNLEQRDSQAELFRRINTWRQEQVNHDSDPEAVADSRMAVSPWQLLKNAATGAWHRLVDLDDRTIDALLGAHPDQKKYGDPLASPHLYHARQRGPPGWEKRMLNHVAKSPISTRNETSFVFAILVRVLLWRQKKSGGPGVNPLLTEPGNPGHSYHYPEIQRSIASLTASVPGSDYSDGWAGSASNTSSLIST